MRFNGTRRSFTLRHVSAAAMGLALFNAAPAGAADSGSATLRDWSGLYAGIDLGAAWGSFKSYSATSAAGGYFTPAFGLTSADLAAVNSLGNQKVRGSGFAGGLEIGNNWQDGNFVAGIAADFDYMHLNGSGWRSAAYGNSLQFLESSYGNADWLVTLRPRIGYATANRLVYVTGGLALANPREDALFTDGNGGFESATRNTLQAGYAIGAGLEWGLSDRLTMKAEYLHVGFGDESGHETSNIMVPPIVSPAQAFSHRFNANADIVRIGLSYQLGAADALFDGEPMVSSGLSDWFSDWQVDVGLRVWANSGWIGAPDPLFNYYTPPTIPKILASRITFTQLGSVSGETYARFDHASGFFIKGYAGGGGINSGHQNDEDFPAANVYSNTLSSASGSLGYATIDGGYSFLRSPTAKFGAFAGYSYYTEHVNTFGCTQIAQDYVCGVTGKPPGLTQDDAYQALRVGVSSQFMPTDTLRFSTDIAYLPAVLMDGKDDHNFRQLILPQAATSGDGVMLDASLDYMLTDAWSVGVGGRYWTYNMRNGSTAFNFLGAPPILLEPSLYNSERYGFFLQSGYRFGAVDKAHADSDAKPVDWTGLYAGLTLGAGMSLEKWRDPYGSTTFFGYTNQAGFGDSDHASGVLPGGRLAGNWQFDDNWVVGLEAEASWANVRGQNTCFSGLGGVGCGHIISAVYDIAARGGYAWDNMLAYLKVGGAQVQSKESVFGVTYAYGFTGTSNVTGNDHANQTLSGLLVGAGAEWAIADNWTGSFEYNHISGLDAKAMFPNVTVVGATPQHVSQNMDLIRVGLSYKLY